MGKFGVKIARGAVKVIGSFPLKVHYAFAGFITWILRDVMKYRNDVVMTNLARSFPEKKYDELRQISKEYYKHLGEIFVEAIWFGASDYKRLYKSGIVTITNPEVVNRVFENAPNTTVLFSHCGNWELLGGIIGYRTATGEKLAFDEEHIRVVYKELHSKFSDEFFRLNRVSALEKMGVECTVESMQILRYAIKNRREKRFYVYIADQFPYASLNYEVGQFLNQHTLGMLGGAGVAHKLGHGVLYMKMKRVERGRYEWTFETICDDASTMAPEDIMRMDWLAANVIGEIPSLEQLVDNAKAMVEIKGVEENTES